MVVLTSKGPLAEAPGLISLFEFPTFGVPHLARPEASLEPVTLRSRLRMLRSPGKYHDALGLAKEDVVEEVEETELAAIGSFSEIRTSKLPVILSARLPSSGPQTTKEKVAWLITAVLFGIDGNFYGMLGPVTTIAEAEVFLAAHFETGAPLIFRLEQRAEVQEVIGIIKSRNMDSGRICFLNSLEAMEHVIRETEAYLGFTCPCLESEIATEKFPSPGIAGIRPSDVRRILDVVPQERILLSSGIFLKPHLKKYGGAGVGLCKDLLLAGTGASDVAKNILGVNTWRFLSFDWKKPETEKIVVKQIWTCHVCGKQDTEDVRNYSKLGFVYCSMGCLGKHRALGFP